MAGGVVHVTWYATGFRADPLEGALAQIASVSLRYGATWYAVHRSSEDRYRFQLMVAFPDKDTWTRYWYGPDFQRFRSEHSSWYQVPLAYDWCDVVTEGGLEAEAAQEPTAAS